MPDNDNDLSQRLAVVEQTFGLRSNNAVANPNPNDVEQPMLITLIGKHFIKSLKAKLKLLSLILIAHSMCVIGVTG